MTAASQRAKGGLGLALLLGVFGAFGPLSMDLYLPQLPLLARDLGTSDTLAQLTMSVCMIGLGVGQLIAGPLSDRLGRRRPLIVGVLGFAALSLACAFAPTIELLLVFRALQGLSGAAGIVIAMAIARDLYSGIELSRMLSLLGIVGSVTPIVAPVVGGQLALFMDWRGIFLVLAGVGVVIAGLAVVFAPETLDRDRRHVGGAGTTVRHLRELARDRVFVSVLAAALVGGVAFFSYLSMSSFVLQESYGLDAQAFSLAFAVNAFAGLLGSQLSRPLVRRVGPLRLYLTSQSLAAAAGIALIVAGAVSAGLALLLLGLVAYMLTTGVGGPNGSTIALEDHGLRAGTAAAVMGTASLIVGPVVAPLVALGGATPLKFVLAIGIPALVACAIGWLVVRPAVRARAWRNAAYPATGSIALPR